jgi:hypothetical protein
MVSFRHPFIGIFFDYSRNILYVQLYLIKCLNWLILDIATENEICIKNLGKNLLLFTHHSRFIPEGIT